MSNILGLIKRSPLLVVAIVLALLALGYGAYLGLRTKAVEERKASPPVFVEVEEVRVGSLTRTITAVGTLRANQMIELRSEIPGLVSEIYVRGGEYIGAGAPLFSIDDRSYKAEVQRAQAQLTNAQLGFERAQKLAANKLTAQKKNFDEAEANFKMAEANVDKAESELSKTKITAPFEGIVGLHNLSVGAHLDSNKEILTLVDITPIKVDFRVPAEYLPYLSVAQKVSVVVDGFGTTAFPGLIEGIDSKVDPVTHSINARAVVPNKKHLLKPGLFSRVDVVVGAKDNTLIIPSAAIDKQGDQDMVYKVVEGLAFHVPVITGIQEGENVEVLRGLNPGDHVVTVGQMKIRDQVPVRYTLDGKEYSFNEKSVDNLKKLFGKDEEKGADKTETKATEPAKAEPGKAGTKPVAPSKDAAPVRTDVPAVTAPVKKDEAPAVTPDAPTPKDVPNLPDAKTQPAEPAPEVKTDATTPQTAPVIQTPQAPTPTVTTPTPAPAPAPEATPVVAPPAPDQGATTPSPVAQGR